MSRRKKPQPFVADPARDGWGVLPVLRFSDFLQRLAETGACARARVNLSEVFMPDDSITALSFLRYMLANGRNRNGAFVVQRRSGKGRVVFTVGHFSWAAALLLDEATAVWLADRLRLGWNIHNGYGEVRGALVRGALSHGTTPRDLVAALEQRARDNARRLRCRCRCHQAVR